jgi:hypothetical protein
MRSVVPGPELSSGFLEPSHDAACCASVAIPSIASIAAGGVAQVPSPAFVLYGKLADDGGHQRLHERRIQVFGMPGERDPRSRSLRALCLLKIDAERGAHFCS